MDFNIYNIYDSGFVLNVNDIIGDGITAVFGTSGSGKTTLLNCLSGLDSINSGNIFVDQKPIHDLSDDKMSEFRSKSMGFIFQTYNLLTVITARENVEMPLLISGMSSKDAANQANEQLEAVGLLDWSTHKPGELSGGQRQRVAIARALVNILEEIKYMTVW